MKDKRFYYIKVVDCAEDFIVFAHTQTEAKDKVYKELNERYPRKELKEKGLPPFTKKDIYSCEELVRLLTDDILAIY